MKEESYVEVEIVDSLVEAKLPILVIDKVTLKLYWFPELNQDHDKIIVIDYREKRVVCLPYDKTRYHLLIQPWIAELYTDLVMFGIVKL